MSGGALEAKQQALLALRSMQARIEALERERSEPIAVIGTACRFPGGVHDLASFRVLLEGGVDAVSEVPAVRWDVDAFYAPEPGTPGKMYTRRMGWVEGADLFDPAFFGLGVREAVRMDPQHRLLLEAAWEALEDAGQAPGSLSGSSTGVFVGISTSDYAQMALTSLAGGAIDAYASTSAAFSVAAGRISYLLGLQGPSIALDTACSSSLVAVHLAAESLRLGDCRMALVGGVNLVLSPLATVALCQMRMMAPDGRCKTFDASADGYVRGEGCGLVVLKRLGDARKDRDRILAVIRGSAVNQDGRSGGLTAPNGAAQEAVIRRALANGRVESREVGYVEAHGTGTALGDPIEMQALGAVYGEGRERSEPLRVGSVKTNLGHLEAAAGIAGLLKAVATVGARSIPPHLHLRNPSPHIPWERLAVEVPTFPAPWRDGRRVAGVSSFGFSGTNAHVIVEEAPPDARSPDTGERGERDLVLPLSARTRGALRELVERTREFLRDDARTLDHCFTAATGRTGLPLRIAVVGRSREELRSALDAYLRSESSPGLVESGRTPPSACMADGADGAADAGALSVARRWVAGDEVDWKPLFSGRDVRRAPLPTYPFQRIRCWMEGLGTLDVPEAPGSPAAGGPRPAVYDLSWTGAESEERPGAAPEAGGPLRWRIVADAGSAPLASALARSLENAGCLEVAVADALPEPGDGQTREGVVVLAATGDAGAETSPAQAARSAPGACLGLLAALRGATARRPAASRFVVVTRGAGAPRGPLEMERTVSAVAVSVAALGRTLLAEHPELSPSLVDLDPDEPATGQADALARELLADAGTGGGREVALRRGKRLVPRLVARPSPGGVPVPPLRTAGSALITGGLGALGLALAARLAKRGVKKIILAGRGGEEGADEETRRALSALRAGGADVRVVTADVTRREDVERLLAPSPGAGEPPVTALFHAAGVLSDALLANQTEENVRTAFGAKALGAALLDEVSRELGLPLDTFVLFSSAAALLGPPGQGSYAAANAFLGALARKRREDGLPALAVHWGPWAGRGMAARTDRRGLAARGLGLLPAEAALDALERLVADGSAEGAVLVLDRSFFAGAPAKALPDLPRRLGGLPPEERQGVAASFVRGQVADLLGFTDPGAIDTRRGFFDLGLDSLLALELRGRLQAALGEDRPLPSTLILDHPTVESVAARLVRELGDGAEPDLSRAPSTTPLRLAFDPIAIVGLAVRFPGAPDVDSFRELLVEGRDAITVVPATRWDVEALYDPDPDAPGKMATRWGGFVDGVESFDARFFGITPREAASIDPQHRFLLEESWHALEDAGIPAESLEGTRTAVFVGISGNDYGPLLAGGDRSRVTAHFGLGNSFSAAAGRIAYTFGLTGPAVALDTACSSSLVALHQAAASLRTGEASLALAAGVNLILAPEATINLSRARMMAPDGRCKTFDASADGYVRGEGCGVVVLERLSDAVANGHPVRALLLGSAVNQDGRSAGLTAPNGPSQEAVLAEALASAGVAPADVDYVEAHGTGTSLGDPIELHAMGAVYGKGRPADRPLLTGSVKTNLGHLEAAAGMAGLAKAVLTLEAGEVLPHLHLKTPNPLVDWDRIAVRVPTEKTPWPSTGRPRRAAVSSFGFIGTNAHVILEAAPAPPADAPEREDAAEEAQLLLLSARSPEALRDLASRFEERLRTGTADRELGDIAFSARAGRSALAHRLAIVGATAGEIADGLAAFREGRTGAGIARGVASSVPSSGPPPGSPLSLPEPFTREALERLGAAWVRGDRVDLEPLDRRSSRKRVRLPLYPFRKERHWGPDLPGAIAPPVAGVPVAARPFLGPALATAFGATLFDTTWSAASLPFLAEHRIHGRIVVPGAAHVSLVLSALRSLHGPGPWRLSDVSFPEPLVLGEEEHRRVQLVLGPGESFQVASRREGPVEPFVVHARGKAAPLVDAAPVDGPRPATAPQAPPGESIPGTALREELSLRGISLGPSFGWIESVVPGPGAATGLLERPRDLSLRGLEGTFAAALHPGLLDSVFQLVAAALPGAALRDTAYVPFAFERLDEKAADAPLDGLEARVAVSHEEGVRSSVVASLSIGDGKGRELFSIEGLTLRAAPREAFAPGTTGSADAGQELFQLAWRRVAAPGPGATGGRWLVLGGQEGDGERLAAALVRSGVDARSLRDLEGRSLIASAAGAGPERIVFLAGEESGGDPFAQCRRLLLLCQALAGSAGDATRLDVVTRGAQGVCDEDARLSTGGAAVWGLVRSLAQEHPGLAPRLVDLPAARRVPAGALASELEEALAAELLAADRSETQVGLRISGRFVARLAGLPLAPGGRLALREKSTHLVTGGLGALGLHVARLLVARGAGRVVLAGRGEPGAAARALVASSGGSVEVVRADVSREEEVARLLETVRRSGPPLAGVFHAAGVLDDGALLRLTWERFEKVLAPKARAALLLDRETEGDRLDHFVLFSSAVSLLGAAGQASYAAANAALDALALDRQRRGLPGLSVSWGPWAGEGMAARAGDEARRVREERGIALLPPSRALELLERLLVAGLPHATVLPVRWERLLRPVPAGVPPFLAEVAPPGGEALSASPSPAAAARPARPAPPAWGPLLAGRQGAALRERIAELIAERAAAVMGLADPSAVARGVPLLEQGLDSLMTLELARTLEESSGIAVPATTVFRHPTVEGLAGHLSERLAPAAVKEVPEPLPAEIAALGEEELRSALARELDAIGEGDAPGGPRR